MQFLLASTLILLWVVVLLNLFLTLGIIRRINNQSSTQKDAYAPERLQKGDRAPDFITETSDGQQVSLTTYAGRSVVLLFISTHCDPCRDILRELVEAASLATQVGVEFVFVILDEASVVHDFVEEFQLTLPVLIAPQRSNDFAIDYKSTRTPSYCLIDGQGLIQAAGYPRYGEWQELVESWKKHKVQVPNAITMERR